MASAMRKMAVYLGLVEDDHRYDDRYTDEYASDEYDEYGDQSDLPDPDDRQEVHAGHGDVSLENGRLKPQSPVEVSDFAGPHVSTVTQYSRIQAPLRKTSLGAMQKDRRIRPYRDHTIASVSARIHTYRTDTEAIV